MSNVQHVMVCCWISLTVRHMPGRGRAGMSNCCPNKSLLLFYAYVEIHLERTLVIDNNQRCPVSLNKKYQVLMSLLSLPNWDVNPAIVIGRMAYEWLHQQRQRAPVWRAPAGQAWGHGFKSRCKSVCVCSTPISRTHLTNHNIVIGAFKTAVGHYTFNYNCTCFFNKIKFFNKTRTFAKGLHFTLCFGFVS